MTDTHWCERFVDELVLARARYSPAMLRRRSTHAEIRSYARALDDDPNKPFTIEEHDASIAMLKAFFDTRAQFVDQWLMTDHCPATW